MFISRDIFANDLLDFDASSEIVFLHSRGEFFVFFSSLASFQEKISYWQQNQWILFNSTSNIRSKNVAAYPMKCYTKFKWQILH